MEEDGEYPKELENISVTYKDVPEGGISFPMEMEYCGDSPSLRRGNVNEFQTPLEACRVAGGFSYSLIKNSSKFKQVRKSKHEGWQIDWVCLEKYYNGGHASISWNHIEDESG